MLNEQNELELKGKFIFIGPDGSVKRTLEKVFTTLNPKLENQNIAVLFDTSEEYAAQAIEMLQNDPDVNLIISSVLGSRSDEKTIQQLVQSPRVKIAKPIEILDIIVKAKEFGQKPEEEQNFDPAIIAASTEIKQKTLRVLQHDLKDYVIAEKGEKYAKIIADARKLFGFNPEMSDTEVEQFILASKGNVPEVMHGNIEGVFTDFDDTLILKDGTLNEKVVNMLKEFAAAGKKVTIWTGGDPAEAAKKLEKLGDNEDVTFLKGLKLVSKYDFAGATAEIVIDDMAQEALGIMFKIRAKKFIKA